MPLFQVESFLLLPSQRFQFLILLPDLTLARTLDLVPIIELLNGPNYSLFVDGLKFAELAVNISHHGLVECSFLPWLYSFQEAKNHL